MPPSVGGCERFTLGLNGEPSDYQEVENFFNAVLGGVVWGACRTEILRELLEGAVGFLCEHAEDLVGHVQDYREIP